ncbi:response regulator [Gorillibacterium sp. CAU 1737]|uniref:response regulator n=1 Tax=Gorillibacterium sp. CAU 1737 TaxID=3140362 RepID=UPI0032617961
MGFSKRQYTGFGLILAFLFLLLTIMILMLNTLKGSFDEITGDRYGKVDTISDVRFLVNKFDGEMTKALADAEHQQEHLDRIRPIKQEISTLMSSLQRMVNTTEGISLVAVMENQLNDFYVFQQSIASSLSTGNREEAAQLLFTQGSSMMEPLMTTIDSFESFQQKTVEDRRADYEKNHQLTFQIIVVSGLFFLVLGILTALWVIKTTTGSLRKVKETMNRVDVAAPEALPTLQIETADEIGAISAAFNQMITHIETFRSNERAYNTRMERENRLQARLAEVSELFLGISDMTVLGERFIRTVTPMVNASYGVIYLARRDTLLKLAAYADSSAEVGVNEIRFGQGLAGQAALEQRVIKLDQEEDSLIQISSALGTAPARFLRIAPILYESRTIAVLEFASLNPFSAEDEELLTQIAATMGITVDNIEGRMEVERLLAESQTLTEELQSQTEELQSQSEELQSQSEELQSQSEELRISNEQLEEQNGFILQRAGELDSIRKELQNRNDELEQSFRYKSEFLANMSHELRTPLNSILILSQMLTENRRGHLNEEEREYSQTIHQSGQDLLTLINDILDLSKVEAGKVQLEIGEVGLHDLPAMFKWNFAPLAEKKGLAFSTVVQPGVPDVMLTDELRLHQILKNLLSNAIKFTHQGSVELSVYQPNEEELRRVAPCGEEAEQAVLFAPGEMSSRELAGRQLPDCVAFAVTDTGIGVPCDKREIIFEAFQQADGATSRKYGGTGLGLSISKEFAALLGGFIVMDSEEGKGSTFTLYLPVRYTKELADLCTSRHSGGVANATRHMVASAIDHSEVREGSGSLKGIPLTEQTVDSADRLLAGTVNLVQMDNELFRNKRVLIVDDDVRNVFALTVALENQGMQVRSAMNGKEAIEELLKDPAYDLVLMDIMMPEMDGYEAMRVIRGELELDKLPVIALTAKAMRNDREKCLEAGASDYISKPLNLDQLLSLMRVWLTH